jgi:hypothetical protein
MNVKRAVVKPSKRWENYLERKHGKQRPRIDIFLGNTQRRPRLDMGCSAKEEEVSLIGKGELK